MGKIIINKAKFLKDRCLIEYTEQRGGNIQPSKISEERTDSPHVDLKEQFKKLSLHAAALAEFISTSEITDIENFIHPDLERFHVTGLSISGEDRDEKRNHKARIIQKENDVTAFIQAQDLRKRHTR